MYTKKRPSRMQKFKKVFLVLFLLIIALATGSWMYINSLKPDYSGTIQLQNIEQETAVYFDDYGIPHIYAENQLDATIALGYVHAQDRLWQMELMRRIAPGKLSEIFGKDMLKNDRFFSSLEIEENSILASKQIDKKSEAFKIASAYIDGVNQFIENGPTPIEFTLIGIEKKPYEIKDMYNILGYMAFSFAMAHKTDPMLSILQEKLGANYLKELNIDVDPSSTLIKNSKIKHDELISMVTDINDIMSKSPIPPFIGSNSWVISPEKSATGKVLFANDPHIAFSQPGTWYEAHINTPDYEMYGYHIAGIPFPLLGHNRKYAYGLTMFENDDIDFYYEEVHPSKTGSYKTPDGYANFETTTKTIKVKDEADVTINIKKSRHGVIINDVIDGVQKSAPIAMSWVYTMFDNKLLEAVYGMSRATKITEVENAVAKIHAPGLNVMYGDAEGNVAWWAAGKLYKHNPHVNTKFILDGATGLDDPIAYLDFENNPMAKNPSWNYVYSANNQPDSIADMLYPGYYLPEDRGKRIVELLAPKNNWTKETFSSMINDVRSSVSPAIIKEFTDGMHYNSFSKNEQRAIDILQLWDGTNTVDAIAPTIYNKWIYLYLKNTFEDEMGKEVFENLLNTHLMKRTIGSHIASDNSIWWDNIHTNGQKETKNEVLSNSLIEAVSFLESQLGADMKDWSWGKVHTLEHKHPLGTIGALKPYFNVGPFPIKGAREVIDNRGYNYNNSGLYEVNSGPSTRRVIDFSDIENSISILPTGQSGNPFSPFYKDQTEMFNNGKFRKMKMNRAEIINVSTKLTVLPNNE